MEKLKSIKKFQEENCNSILDYGKNSLIGGIGAPVGDDSLTHQDTPTQTEWNCSDTDRTMYWDGSPCSKPFRIYTEQP